MRAPTLTGHRWYPARGCAARRFTSRFEFLPLARLAIVFRLSEVTHGPLCNIRKSWVFSFLS